MSAIIKTEAIVLRSIKYGETSKIVTLYTKDLGRVGAIVKGIRKREGKYGSSLEPMSYVQVVLYSRESREVQTVGQCELLQSFHHISHDLEKISAGLSLVELVYSIAQEQEQNIHLFNLLKDSLVFLEKPEAKPGIIYHYFELKLMELLGFTPVFDVCSNCRRVVINGNNVSWQLYNVSKGSPVCDNCSHTQESVFRISSVALNLLQRMMQLPNPGALQGIAINVEKEAEIEDFLTKYLQSHVHGFKIPRSRKIFKSVSL